MISVDYQRLYAELKKHRYSPQRVELLHRILRSGIAYKFKRKNCHTFEYEFVLPGYGKLPNKTKWTDVKVIH